MSTKVSVTNDQQVSSLLNNAELRRRFPFLATAHLRITSQPRSSCHTCPGKKKANAAEYEKIKRAIAQLSVDDKAALKQALGAKQVEVKYRASTSKVVTLRF